MEGGVRECDGGEAERGGFGAKMLRRLSGVDVERMRMRMEMEMEMEKADGEDEDEG